MISPEFPEEIPNRVPNRTLREFSLLVLLVFGLLFGLSYYRHQGAPSLSGWIAGVIAVGFGLTGVILPNLVRPVFMASMAITSPIGHVVGTVLLALIYFGMITPIAMIFRLMGRDALRLKPGKATSYWQDHVPTADVNQYLRQYQPQTAPPTQKSSSTVAITDNIAGSKHAQTI